jgi:hypothetical protein
VRIPLNDLAPPFRTHGKKEGQSAPQSGFSIGPDFLDPDFLVRDVRVVGLRWLVVMTRLESLAHSWLRLAEELESVEGYAEPPEGARKEGKLERD